MRASHDKKLPTIGLDIYDEGAQLVGKITDIIGPVYNPYFKIKPSRPLNLSSSSFSSHIGEPLYVLTDSRGKNLSKKGKFSGRRMKAKRQPSNKPEKKIQKIPRNTEKISKNKASSPK